MKAFSITAPGQWSFSEVDAPVPAPNEVVVAVHRVGLCGTDLEFFRGTQPYLAAGTARYPMRIGHEWSGRVTCVGADVDEAWVGRRVTGDTMLGCRHCDMCRRGSQHLCPDRTEIGVLRGRPGALAEELAVPATTIHALPDSMSDGLGALVEPASLALRAVKALQAPPGEQVLVWGTGAIGLIAVALGAARGLQMAAVSRSARSFGLARELGAMETFTESELAGRADIAGCVIAASPDAAVPGKAMRLLHDGGRIVLIGISGDRSPLEARELVTRDISLQGLLSGSPVFAETIAAIRKGGLASRLERLIGAVLPFDRAADALNGTAPMDVDRGPKVQIAVRQKFAAAKHERAASTDGHA